MKTKIKITKYKSAVLATWAVAAGAIIVGYFMFMAPLTLKLTQLHNQCEESQQQADHALEAALPKTQNRLLEQCENSKTLIESFSISQTDITGLHFEVGQIANELALSKFSSKTQNNGGYSTLGKSEILTENRLNVEFESSFEQFVRYVNKLERNEPVVFVEELLFRRSTGGSDANKVKLDLSFLTQTEKATHSLAMAASQ